MKFVLSDGRLSTSTTLTITIQNENEGFSFLAGSYTVAADEGPVCTSSSTLVNNLSSHSVFDRLLQFIKNFYQTFLYIVYMIKMALL